MRPMIEPFNMGEAAVDFKGPLLFAPTIIIVKTNDSRVLVMGNGFPFISFLQCGTGSGAKQPIGCDCL